MLLTLLAFIAVLSILVFVHEIGHFLTAKKFGMKVEEFGFGFPPRLWGINRGGTIYSINWIPLGGFVKIKGEQGENKEDLDSFASRPIWQRFIVLSSGVGMNIALAYILISFGLMFGLPTILGADQVSHAKIKNQQIQIASILPDSPADQSGLQPGDIIKEIDERSFSKIEEIQEYIGGQANQSVILSILRGEQIITLKITPQKIMEEEKAKLGVGLLQTATISYPPHWAFFQGAKTTGIIIWEIFKALYNLIRGLVTPAEVTVDFAGPVGIAVITGQAARAGIVYLFQFIALLSINLGIINFLPFPALDGGRVLFLAIEKIRRKPTDQAVEAVVHNIGFMILIILVLLVTYRDIVKFSSQIIGGLKSVIGL